MPSANIAELPVTTDAANLVTAIKALPISAAYMTFFDEDAMRTRLSNDPIPRTIKSKHKDLDSTQIPKRKSVLQSVLSPLGYGHSFIHIVGGGQYS